MTIHKAKIEIGTPETGYRQKEAGELPFIGSIPFGALKATVPDEPGDIQAIRELREFQKERSKQGNRG